MTQQQADPLTQDPPPQHPSPCPGWCCTPTTTDHDE
ncbi:hypothetical protein SAMN05216561_11537 [Nocardioides psychrotolerans]|uniref:Uncharacterized protein n=1 Tax=Nocardioides psychrotolerans TaxID=1005945 RepID=A0A1I3MBU1_9ACTN|nr:hypothetical protein SAMN05216561_11537 [Nocardioides psychrotolerans]